MQNLKFIFSALLVLVIVVSFQNCSSDFQPNSNISSSASGAIANGLDGMPLTIAATPTPFLASSSPKLISRSSTTYGTGYTCAVINGGVQCAGQNNFGLFGPTASAIRPNMAVIPGLESGVETVTGSENHACVLLNGGVKCWGLNNLGQLGTGNLVPIYTPANVAGLGSGVKMISSGNSHNCALLATGGVKCWGDNSFGAIGDGTTVTRNSPVDVPGLTSGVVAISAGGNHTCAVIASGGIKCWGRNDRGQIGDSTMISKLVPTTVVGINSEVKMISAGSFHSCAIVANMVKCWGNNDMGQLGNGSVAQANIPTAVLGLNVGVNEITSGDQTTCAIIGSGATAVSKCWGRNDYGAVGDGTTVSRNSPATVTLVGPNSATVTQMSTSAYHSCAMTLAGLQCWGLNTAGQLGDGSYESQFNPPAAPVDPSINQNNGGGGP
jgi:alpha-tubulin suppressor-like RCC1 family protein